MLFLSPIKNRRFFIPMAQKTKRLNWGKTYTELVPLDLTAIQRDSYYWFLNEGIAETLAEISPVEDFTGKNWMLSFKKHYFGQPKYTSKEALQKGGTYDRPLRAEVVLVNKKTGKEIKGEVFLGDIPQMTESATFVINGIERAVVNQIIRSPGVFFSGEIDRTSGRMLYNAEIRPLHGAWLEFFIARNNLVSVRIDRRRKLPATVLLRAFGLSGDEQILESLTPAAGGVSPERKKAFLTFVLATLEKDPTKTQSEAFLEIYQKMRPGEPAVLENASEMFTNMFLSYRRYNLGKVGRFKINKRLGLETENKKENWILNQTDIVETVKYLLQLQNGEGRVDDIDHLANRRIRAVGELINDAAFRVGILRLERSIKEKMSLVSAEERVTPAQLVNARSVVATINEFFRSNQLSAILDQVNPLSELDNLRRISVMGPGGITRERASFSIRDINASQYGRICPVRSPEGPNIGLVTYLSLYARLSEYDFLETPYRKVEKENGRVKITNQIVYLTADDEQEHYITHANVNTDKRGNITNSWVPVRYRGEFLEAPVEKVEFADLVPSQIVGVSASLIPFLAHDEANRALMGANMQCQAVPLIRPQAPIIGTGMEKVVPEQMRWVVRARHNARVTDVDGEKIVLKIDRGEKKLSSAENIEVQGGEEVYHLRKFKRTSPSSTCYSQRPLVNVGDRVKKGDLLIDGPACENGELALGTNLLIAYCSFEGLEYEDAIVVSDRLVREDVLTSINIEEYETLIVETKLGPEELTCDIPNVGEADLANLAEDGIVVVGSEVGPNDILVGKIAPKGETELTAEERLLRAIFGEKAREVRDTSLRMPHGEVGTVIDVQIFDREKSDELEPGTLKKVIVRVAQMRKVTVGDKLAGRHGNKGVISKIVPQADMPFLEDGVPVDVIISPLSVLARMNLGQLFETHLGWAAKKLGCQVAIPVFEEIGEDKIAQELKRAGLPVDGKVYLRDGRTGKPHQRKSVVGVGYMLKLVHMVEDKVHARSTGPYSLVTQQPLGGKAQMGGQRLGEMEVWALESHRAAYTLQEMLTIKSDDVVGRAKAFEAIVRGTKIPEATIPESFKVLIKELNSLGLDVIPIEAVEEKSSGESTPESEEENKEKEKVKEEAKELAEAAGAKIVR